MAEATAPGHERSRPGAGDLEIEAGELARLGEAIWGRWGWQTRLAEEFGCCSSTVRKYKAGRLPVPRSMAAFLRERYARMTSSGARDDRTLKGRILRRGGELIIRLDDGIDELHVTLDPQPVEIEASGTTLVIRRKSN